MSGITGQYLIDELADSLKQLKEKMKYIEQKIDDVEKEMKALEGLAFTKTPDGRAG